MTAGTVVLVPTRRYRPLSGKSIVRSDPGKSRFSRMSPYKSAGAYPIEQHMRSARIGSKDVGLGARAKSRSSLCESSSVSLVDLVLVEGCMLLLKNYIYINSVSQFTNIDPAGPVLSYLPVLVP